MIVAPAHPITTITFGLQLPSSIPAALPAKTSLSDKFVDPFAITWKVIVARTRLPVALPVPAGVRVLHNDRSTEGQATSLALAVERGRTAGHDVLVVGLGDQPFLTPEAWRAVAAAVSLERPLATASYDGVAGQPVAMHSSLWDEIPTTGDAGARSLLSRHRDLLVEVPCTGSPADIDTLEDLARWS